MLDWGVASSTDSPRISNAGLVALPWPKVGLRSGTTADLNLLERL